MTYTFIFLLYAKTPNETIRPIAAKIAQPPVANTPIMNSITFLEVILVENGFSLTLLIRVDWRPEHEDKR